MNIYDIEQCVELESREIANIIENTEFALSTSSDYQKECIKIKAYDEIVELIGCREEALKMCADFLGWIPVSKRLPERNKRVLVCYETMEGLKVDTSIFDKYGCWLGKAVAWMPLPKPYKNERGEE